jgi:hypothetical protein
MMREPGNQKEDIQVLFAGFGRSGSHSFAAAFQRLGYNACHGADIFGGIASSHKGLADAMMENNVDRVVDITENMGYNATLEFHAVFWRQIAEKRPNAKLVFIIRDFPSWFTSMVTMRTAVSPINRYPLRVFPLFDVMTKLAFRLAAIDFGSRSSDANYDDDDNNVQVTGEELVRNPTSEHSKRLHQQAHEQYVMDALEITTNHPDRAILFDLNQHGYQELCDFLQTPSCPLIPNDEPFPHLGSSAYICRLGLVFQTIEVALYLLAVLYVYLVLKGLSRGIQAAVVASNSTQPSNIKSKVH